MKERQKRMGYDDFIKTYGLSEINEMAKEYLRPAATKSFVCEKYNISDKTFDKLLDLGIVECFIPKDTVISMREKARLNQVKHRPSYIPADTAPSSTLKYDRLLQEREAFIKKYDEEIINLHYMIEAYNDFGFEEKGAIPKSSLQARLDELESRRIELESF